MEELLITARANTKVDPHLAIWSWEIPVYLFMGGLTAGIMFLAAWVILTRRDDQAPFAAGPLALWAPIVLSIGMTTLFLDLEHKLYVWRFYTTLQPASPMSWGSWELIIIYGLSVAQVLSTLRRGYPTLAGLFGKLPFADQAMDLAERHRTTIAAWVIPFAVMLAIYTGILLSAFSARPFWNTGILGPLFLISGLSTAAALVALVAREKSEKHLFVRIDVGLILVELLLIGLLVINLASGSAVQLEAVAHILGGDYTRLFWLWFVGLGLLVPLALELVEMRTRRAVLAPIVLVVAPLLVIGGGYLLRHITVELGQLTTWTHYASAYDNSLLDRLQRP